MFRNASKLDNDACSAFARSGEKAGDTSVLVPDESAYLERFNRQLEEKTSFYHSRSWQETLGDSGEQVSAMVIVAGNEVNKKHRSCIETTVLIWLPRRDSNLQQLG